MDDSLSKLLVIDRSLLFGIVGATFAGLIGFLYFKMGSGLGIVRRSKLDTNIKEEVKEKSTDEEKYPNGKISIYFGSQTGTAEGFARTLMEECKEHGYNPKIIDLEDFDEHVLANTKLAIFLMATYGEGEPTDNANKFYKWLKNDDKEIESKFLSNLNYCVFGLGNQQYEQFNRMGKVTDQWLNDLGAKRLYELGLGDDDGSLEDDFEKWRESIWLSLPTNTKFTGESAVSSIIGSPIGNLNIASRNSSTLSFRDIDYVFSVVKSNKNSPKRESVSSLAKHFFHSTKVTVVENRELRNITQKNGFDIIGSTRHIEIDLSHTDIKYETADNLSVLPENDPKVVETLAQALGYDLDTLFDVDVLKPDQFKLNFPLPNTMRTVLTKFLDIQGPVKHATLMHIASFITDEKQIEWIINILSKENKALYNQQIIEKHLSLVDLLTNQLSSCKIPLDAFLHVVPILQPRQYTISSSKSIYPKTVHITVAVADKVINDSKVFRGLCSTYLKDSPNCQIGGKCEILIRPSTFRLPNDLSVPIIMIGPGTGIAPMRAMLQEIKYQKQNKDKSFGNVTLYFGCKNSNIDYIYRDEIEEFVKEKTITSLITAFSRESNEKVYVQHLMLKDENAINLWNDLHNGAYIYVCGALSMGADVHTSLKSIISKYGNLSADLAEDYLKNLKIHNRYIQELWA
uniref:NADPH--hemoprotein reductase n=1 Tax=Chromulina nebulosa TaxID=96789 RepID=A0A6T5WBT4_9STRA|mmetsp:Transcript_815/g.710  ORF Transcript_815/g.710 Transcript_815/m.710 type:complete len:685 (+) Transcript_815:57-2111(+)